MMSQRDFEALLAAAADSPFPVFWRDLLRVVRSAKVTLGKVATLATCDHPGIADAIERLQSEEWPFRLAGVGSEYGHESLTRAFRALVRRAGLADSDPLNIDSLCGG
ncbi:MAG: hypothetical protein LLG00_14875 [Planctomycetaceae bacterium]|nr:hypothetical protein [Planctomycetaceae bacterium]